ncbi:tRNA (guanosine(37)-N1)-methyltransferase TrmD [Actinomyces slackii]|uniref:tRNA (guanine-N(1)-)-methyltransferase n=1 Tax=Actinomyces slackii TaxID=52774 RepID=A0A448KF98_9ACTO|nr:tRNA (guanosine(37)-N1)-methyltransferase TrmD [Actinomyces slackii]VEG75613.1 tRNA (guanine-N(1)-)-methyltransferase [Actinomyces slackii]
MRIDVVTIFPDYLRALELSLIGRATTGGPLEIGIHDLRKWTHDRHRTVDDTPIGGGAGMVMKPDVWGEALDELLSAPPPARPDHEADQGGQGGGPSQGGAPVLIIPTPSGEVLTQRIAEDLATREHLVMACGRYEGIDARVAEHYASRGVEVRELSIGDYVLNGGEAAALVIIEAVARLLPGVLGNPDSVVEESHGASGLLEYPVHTRPVSWRGLEPDPALLSGDHGRIRRLRRDQAIARTAQRRPDLISRLDPASLDSADRAALAAQGWVVPAGAASPQPVVIRPARVGDLESIADLAARTFPDACPEYIPAEQIAEHIAANLTPQRFAAWLADERVPLLVARALQAPGGAEEQGPVLGYSTLILEVLDEAGEPPIGLDARPECVQAAPGQVIAELSKVYTDPAMRGSGLAAALVGHSLRLAGEHGVDLVWLGTSTRNKRAQKAYRRAGFALAGERSYGVGAVICHDVVMTRTINRSTAGETA